MSQRYLSDADPQLRRLLLEFTTQIILDQPEDLVAYGAEYFTKLVEKREYSEHVEPEEEEEEELSDNEPIPVPADSEALRMRRRPSVCAEKYDPEEDSVTDIEFYKKTEAQREKIKSVITNCFLFRGMDPADTEKVVDAMSPREVKEGETVIHQGDEGDYFYVIDHGVFEARIANHLGETKAVNTYENSGSFGELALMYNEPRAASVVAMTDGFLWAVSRRTFKRLVLKSAYEKRRRYEKLLKSVPELAPLSSYKRGVVSDALVPKVFNEGNVIFNQGDSGDGMYFVESGEVSIMLKVDGKENEISRIRPGGYFGEMALVTKEPRAAGAVAATDVKLAFLDLKAFERLLGPCTMLLKKRMKDYKK